MNNDVLPLYNLVTARMKEIGLSRHAFIERCGYKNTGKGLRRLDAIWDGDLSSKISCAILAAAPAILDISPETVAAAVSESVSRREQSAQKAEAERAVAAAKRDVAWRASFQPDAYLLGTASRPSQITIYGMTGGAKRWLSIPLDLSKPPVTLAAQALAVARQTPQAPFFGSTTGFVVNYTSDRAVLFDLDGHPKEIFDHAYMPGEVSLSIGGRKINAEDFGTLVGAL